MKTDLLRFDGAVERDPAIEAWMKEHQRRIGSHRAPVVCGDAEMRG